MDINGYLDTGNKADCVGCEACVQICTQSAILLSEDIEGFRYPSIDASKCVQCGLCRKVCPITNMPERHTDDKRAFGGGINDPKIREQSTSGGAFSAIVDTWCDNNYVIFGAEASSLDVFHSFITDKELLGKYRKSKYSQSRIGTSFIDARRFLKEGKKVLFSGTPCQIAGLKSFLQNTPTDNLLTIEVICEGVPTPHYIRRFNEYIQNKHGKEISQIDYRYKDGNKWDFEVMMIKSDKTYKCDRWFNPFWSIWLNHLMSRPACYECRFASISRVADISLGDLWGVHLYCPELYANNSGASLIVCNTSKGKDALEKARPLLSGHELVFEDALRYQSPLRKTISQNEKRGLFLKDVLVMDYKSLTKKWAKRPSIKLLYHKYIWGNRQKVAMWNLHHLFQKSNKQVNKKEHD